MRLDVETDLLSLLMPWYREVLDYQEICQTEEAELENLASSMEGVQGNFFFQTMDESSVAQWEQIFGIIADPVTEDLEFRRARLLNRISTKPPFTLGFLYQKLDEIFGAGNYTVEVDYPNYTLYIESSAQNAAWAGEIVVTINTIKPCHMVYINRPYLSNLILESEAVNLSRLNYNYALGSWGLGLGPFADEQDLGVVKLPTQKSIQTELLNETAAAIAAAAASARINGSVSITPLTKSSSGNTAVITYTVTEAQAEVVTQVELLDTDGNVLTSSGVYVPITTSAQFKHNFVVEEGQNAN